MAEKRIQMIEQNTMKKNNRRSKSKYANLRPELNLKSRTHLIEADYLHKLNKKELAWLNKFNGEFNNATFDEDPKKNLHKTAEGKKDCYSKNNARNRCILTKAKASGSLDYLEDKPKLTVSPEEELNEAIDTDLTIFEVYTNKGNSKGKRTKNK